MRSVVAALVLLSGMVRALAQEPGAPEPEEVPGQMMLVNGQGGHSAPIRDFAFTADGKKLFTMSADNTIQVWDTVSYEHLQTLRLPWKRAEKIQARGKPTEGLSGFVDPESLLAVSADGKTVALVHTTKQWFPKGPKLKAAKTHYLREVILVDVESGRLVRSSAIQGTFRRLVFSPDGDMLAAGGNTVADKTKQGKFYFDYQNWAGRIWLWRGLQKVLQPEGAGLARPLEWGPEGLAHKVDEIATIEWAPDGSKLAESWHETKGTSKEKPVGGLLKLVYPGGTMRKKIDGLFAHVVWSPDGGRLAAVGTDSRTVRVWTAEGLELRAIESDRALLAPPIFSGAGELLLVGARADNKSAAVLRFDLPDLKKKVLDEVQEFALPEALHRIAFAAGGKRLATLSGAAREVVAILDVQPGAKLQPVGAVMAQTPLVAFSKQGNKLAWTGPNRIELLAGIDLETAEALPATELKAEAFAVPAASASSGGYEAVPRFARGGLFDITKKVAKTKKSKATVQGPVVLTVYAEGQDWVLCTPEGYYAGTPGGERKVGWHVNQGFTRVASFYPFDRFRKKLYRPDVLSLVLTKGSVAEALKVANALRGGEVTRDVEKMLPPRCMLDMLEHDKGKVKLRVRAVAQSKEQPLVGLRLYVDGRPFVPGGWRGLKKVDTNQTSADFPEGKDKVDLTWTFTLPGEKAAGAYQLTVMAGSRDASAPSNAVAVSFVNAAKLPSLHVLAAGINQYNDPALTLNFAAKDARELAEAFAKQARGGLFAQVDTQVILDKQATREAILKHIQKVRKAVKANDLFIVYFAGHGVKEKDQFYLLTVEAKVAALAGSTLSGADLREALGQFPCQVLLMLDACHSAGFGAKGVLRAQNLAPATNDATRALTEDEVAVAVMCAAMGHESALEKNGNGIFTRAVLDALARGNGVPFNPDNHLLYTHHLQAFVFDEVNRQSGGRQHPFLSLPWVVQSFPVAR